MICVCEGFSQETRKGASPPTRLGCGHWGGGDVILSTIQSLSELFCQECEFPLKRACGTSLVVQWLRLRASDAGGVGSIPGRRTKIPHAVRCGQKKKKKKRHVIEGVSQWRCGDKRCHLKLFNAPVFQLLEPEKESVCRWCLGWLFKAKTLAFYYLDGSAFLS